MFSMLGRGTIRVQTPAVIYAYCNGSEKSHLNTDLTCIVCHGRGVLSVHSKKLEICPTCKGKGIQGGGNVPCLIGRGKGFVVKKWVGSTYCYDMLCRL